MKYIIYKNGRDLEDAVVWTQENIAHIDVADSLNSCPFIRNNLKELTAAGFVCFDGKNFICYGNSSTLGLNSRPQDNDIIMINFIPGVKERNK